MRFVIGNPRACEHPWDALSKETPTIGSAVPDRAHLGPRPNHYRKMLHALERVKIYLTATPHAPHVELTAPSGGVVGARWSFELVPHLCELR